MSILTSVSDGLALLVSGAAMATAARALWLASPHRRTKPATPVSTGAATSQPAAQPTPAPPTATAARRTTGNRGGTQGRGNQTREQVRAFLAERAGSDWSLVQVSQGVGRSSATVSYTLDKLVQAGEVELTSPKPRRYTIAAGGDGAAATTDQPAEPTGDATGDVSAPAVAAQARPGRPRGRRATTVQAEAPTAPATARAATTARKPKSKATAAAATRKASTKPAATTAAK